MPNVSLVLASPVVIPSTKISHPLSTPEMFKNAGYEILSSLPGKEYADFDDEEGDFDDEEGAEVDSKDKGKGIDCSSK